jgi:hypothetical protein
VTQLRKQLSRVPLLKACHANLQTLRREFGLSVSWIEGLWRLVSFWSEFRTYRRREKNAAFACRARDVIPCLRDRTATTPIEPVYFVQDTWFAGRIAQRRPGQHIDVGSSAKTMALVAQFVPVTMVDIRPVPIEVTGFTFVQGSILEMPFANGSVASLSSLCVVEHIGLGRYGDQTDPRGSEKALRELQRVLAPGGDFYVSVPVDAENKVYFNAHRAFTRNYLLSLLPTLTLVEERYIYGYALVPAYDPQRGFGTGLYHLRRP